MKGPTSEYTCISVQNGAQKRIQSLAFAGKIPEDQMPERLVRAGLEAYLVGQKESDGGERQGEHAGAGAKN
jgi:hypothetical protein